MIEHKKLHLNIIIKVLDINVIPEQAEKRGFNVLVTALDGCINHGDTEEKSQENAN